MEFLSRLSEFAVAVVVVGPPAAWTVLLYEELITKPRFPSVFRPKPPGPLPTHALLARRVAVVWALVVAATLALHWLGAPVRLTATAVTTAVGFISLVVVHGILEEKRPKLLKAPTNRVAALLVVFVSLAFPAVILGLLFSALGVPLGFDGRE